MKPMPKYQVEVYEMTSGKRPFSIWYKEQEAPIKHTVSARITRAENGLLGDCKVIKEGDGIMEMRIDRGPGFRIYFGIHENKIIILLCAGDKSSQSADIRFAKKYWLDWKESE